FRRPHSPELSEFLPTACPLAILRRSPGGEHLMPHDSNIIDPQLIIFRDDVLAGLSLPQKRLSPRWLYDDRGCNLFEAITGLAEYYPTRTETKILGDHAMEISEFCGPR